MIKCVSQSKRVAQRVEIIVRVCSVCAQPTQLLTHFHTQLEVRDRHDVEGKTEVVHSREKERELCERCGTPEKNAHIFFSRSNINTPIEINSTKTVLTESDRTKYTAKKVGFPRWILDLNIGRKHVFSGTPVIQLKVVPWYAKYETKNLYNVEQGCRRVAQEWSPSSRQGKFGPA